MVQTASVFERYGFAGGDSGFRKSFLIFFDFK